MSKLEYLFATSFMALASVCSTAQAAPATAMEDGDPSQHGSIPKGEPARSDMITTGVAKGRDRLDSAVSTSSLKDIDIVRLAPRSIADRDRRPGRGAVADVRSRTSPACRPIVTSAA